MRKVETIIKLHAMFGDTIRVSDVQVIESLPLLSLFLKTDFCDFIKGQGGDELLSMWAHPTDKLNLGTPHLAVIAAGLGRSLEDDWDCSSFDDRNTVKTVARAFKGVKSADMASELLRGNGKLARFLEEYRGDDKDCLEGMLKSLEYFLTRAAHVHTSEEKSTSYFEVLEKDREILFSKNVATPDLDDVLTFVKREVARGDEKKRYFRTPAILELENRGLENPVNRRRYHTITEAWNLGVSNTVNANYDSIAAFRDVDPLPPLHGALTEFTFPGVVSVSDEEIFQSLPLLKAEWSPETISWYTIGEVRKECRKEIIEFQESTSTPDATGPFEKLVAAISAVVSRRGEGVPLRESVGMLPALMSLGSELGVKVLAMKQSPSVESWVEVGTGVKEWLSILPGITKIHKVLKQVTGAVSYLETRDAIRAHALRYNIRRTPKRESAP
jgi:hypothetical protein